MRMVVIALFKAQSDSPPDETVVKLTLTSISCMMIQFL